MKPSPLQRINRILRFYENRGVNKESVNNIYRKIVKAKMQQKKIIIDLMNEN